MCWSSAFVNIVEPYVIPARQRTLLPYSHAAHVFYVWYSTATIRPARMYTRDPPGGEAVLRAPGVRHAPEPEHGKGSSD